MKTNYASLTEEELTNLLEKATEEKELRTSLEELTAHVKQYPNFPQRNACAMGFNVTAAVERNLLVVDGKGNLNLA